MLATSVVVFVAFLATPTTAAAAGNAAFGGYSVGYHPSEAFLVAPLLPQGAVALPVAGTGDTLGRPETGNGILAAVSLRSTESTGAAQTATDLVAIPAGFATMCVSTVRGSRVRLTVAQLADLVLGDRPDGASASAEYETQGQGEGSRPAAAARRRQRSPAATTATAPTTTTTTTTTPSTAAISDKRRQGGPPDDGSLPPLPPGGTFPPLAPGETFPPLPPGATLPPDSGGGGGPGTPAAAEDVPIPPGGDGGGRDGDEVTPPAAAAAPTGPASQSTTVVLIPNTTVFRRALARGFRVGGVSTERVPSDEELPAAAFSNPHVRWVASVDELEAASYEAAEGTGTTAAFNLVLSVGGTDFVDCTDVVSPRIANETVGLSVGTNAVSAINLYARESAGAYEIPVAELATNVSSDYVFWTSLSMIVNKSALCRVGTAPLRTLLLTFYGGTAAVETMEWQLVAGLDEEPRLRAMAILNNMARVTSDCLDARTGGSSFPMASDGSVRSVATGLGLQYFADKETAVAPEHRGEGTTGVGGTVASVAASSALVGITTAIATATASNGSSPLDTSNLRQVPLASTLLVLEANFGTANDPGAVSPVFQITIPSCVIVGIFNGSITTWSDPAIVEPNFGVVASTFPDAQIHLVLDTSTGIAATLLHSLRSHEVAICGASIPSVAATPQAVQQRLGPARVTLMGTMHEAIYTLLNDAVNGLAVWTEAEARGGSITADIARYSAYTIVPSVRGLELVARAEYLIDVYNRGARLDPATMEVVIDDGSTVTPVYPFAATMYLVYQHAVSTAAFAAASGPATTARRQQQAQPSALPSQALDCAGVRSAMDFMIWSITARRAAGHVSNENLLWLGGFDASAAQAAIESTTCDGAPVYPELVPEAALNLAAVIGGAIAGTIAVGGAVAALIFAVVLRAKTRDVGYAPRDSDEPFAVAFTDVESSTTLWARNAGAMAVGLDLHHAIMRQAIDRRRCYEVKTIGDAFMVACSNAAALLDFALDVQELLFDSAYPTEGPADVFDQIYVDKRREAMAEAAAGPAGAVEECAYAEDPSLEDPQLYGRLWRGLRVRIGLHFGKGDIAFDEVAKGYDYYGSVVNAASRVESSGHGGQCVCTAAFIVAAGLLPGNEGGGPAAEATELGPDGQPAIPDAGTRGDVSWALKGSAVLRGFDAPIKLYQVGRPRFADRFFPPLKVDAPKAQLLAGDEGEQQQQQHCHDGDDEGDDGAGGHHVLSPNGPPINPLGPVAAAAAAASPQPGPGLGVGDDLSSVGSMGSAAFASDAGHGPIGAPVLDLSVPREARVSATAYWIEAAMSAAAPSERRAMLAGMCRAWRLPVVERGMHKPGSRQEATAHRRSLAGLALRLVLIAEDQQRPVKIEASNSYASFRMRGQGGAGAKAAAVVTSPPAAALTTSDAAVPEQHGAGDGVPEETSPPTSSSMAGTDAPADDADVTPAADIQEAA